MPPGLRWITFSLLSLGCARTTNLMNPTSPGFFGSYAAAARDSIPSAELRIVTFNIKLGRAIDRAIEVLGQDSLAGADIIALQEMDESGVERVARALRLNYAYYPGSIHPTDHRYFGPALLSRWPIGRSWKLILPHEGRVRHQLRTATAAVVLVRGVPVLAYAVHLETQLRISEAAREDQVLTILRDGASFPGPVVIAGDFNSEAIGPFLVRRGFHWVTARAGPSIAFFSWDHIFLRGLEPERAGVVRQVRRASDHKPVWAVARVPAGARTLTGLPRVGGNAGGSGGGLCGGS